MVQGFTDKDGKFHPTGSRSPISSTGEKPTSITGLPSREPLGALPKKPEEIQSARRGKFAKERASQFAKLGAEKAKVGLKKSGQGLVAGLRSRKQKKIEKSISQQEDIEKLDRQIDEIVDSDRSDSSKFRLLQRFGILQRGNLSKHQLKIVNEALMELDVRVKETGMTERTIPVETQSPIPPPMSQPTPPTSEGFKKDFDKAKTEGLSPEEFEKLPSMLKEQIIALGGTGR